MAGVQKGDMVFAAVQKHPRYRVSVPVEVVGAAGDATALRLEDISLGGAFIRTPMPHPPGSFVRVRLPIPDAPALMGRVVHVIDGASSVVKSRAPGMGIQFDGLSPANEESLRCFVDRLITEQRRSRARRGDARFVDDAHVQVTKDRGALARLWASGLAEGALEVDGEGRAGNRVVVDIGPLRFGADVLDARPASATLRLVDMQGDKRDALARFIAGVDNVIRVTPARAPDPLLARALAEARRLCTGVEGGDALVGLGLPRGSTGDAVRARAAELAALFSTELPDASPPQRVRLASAARVLIDVEKAAHALIGELLPPPPAAPPAEQVSERLAELLDEATFLESVGRYEEAQEALHEAVAVDPDDVEVARRLLALNDAIDRAHALDLLKDVAGAAREDAVARARKAIDLSSSRDVLMRALRVFSTASADADAVAVAIRCVDQNPTDELPLFALLHLHEAAGRYREAARAGEALLRLRPEDFALKERVRLIVRAARG